MSGWQALEAYWSASELLDNWDKLVDEVGRRYEESHPRNKTAGPGEIGAWRNSVHKLATDLKAAGLGQVWMFVEYRVDGAMEPIDVVLAGVHPVRGTFSYAAIELKQWSQVSRPDNDKTGSSEYVFVPGSANGYNKNKKHPAVQAYDNMVSMRTRHSQFDDRSVNLVAASYLHNLRKAEYQWIRHVPCRPGIPTFTERSPEDLRKFLVANFAPGPSSAAAQELLERRRLGTSLQSVFGDVIRGYSRFTLVETQQEVYETILKRLDEVQGPGPHLKQVFLVQGRAGTGKSLIATELLAKATEQGRGARYVSGGIASRDTFKREAKKFRLGSKFVPLSDLAKNYGDDQLDLVVCDEAHRLYVRPRRGSFGMLDGDSSIAVVVNKAKVPVIFVDGDQRLFKDEVWTPEEIREAALATGAEVVPFTLGICQTR